MGERGPVLVFQDAHLLVIDKPDGMPTAPLADGETGTLLAWVIASFPEVGRVPGRKPVEPGLLHRLDSGTSGLVVVARSAEAFACLRGQFAAAQVQKEYVAACRCAPSGGASPAGTLHLESRFVPCGPHRSRVRVVLPEDRLGRRVSQTTKASYVTDAWVTETAREVALVRARLRKGFRHQVRAHLAFLGYPILGDPLYGAPAPVGARDRLYLHALSLELIHPVTALPLRIEAPIPEEFQALLRSGT